MKSIPAKPVVDVPPPPPPPPSINDSLLSFDDDAPFLAGSTAIVKGDIAQN
jgi:hypothetical protein